MDVKPIFLDRIIVDSHQESIISIKHNHNQDAFAFSTYEFENRSW